MIEIVPYYAKPIDQLDTIDTGQDEIRLDGRRIGWVERKAKATPMLHCRVQADELKKIQAELKRLLPDSQPAKQLPEPPPMPEGARNEDL